MQAESKKSLPDNAEMQSIFAGGIKIAQTDNYAETQPIFTLTEAKIYKINFPPTAKTSILSRK